MIRNSQFYVSTEIHHSRSIFFLQKMLRERKVICICEKRKEKLFVSVVIKDNGHDYDAKSEEEKSF